MEERVTCGACVFDKYVLSCSSMFTTLSQLPRRPAAAARCGLAAAFVAAAHSGPATSFAPAPQHHEHDRSHSAQFIQLIMNELGLGVRRTYMRVHCSTAAWCREGLLLGRAPHGSGRQPWAGPFAPVVSILPNWDCLCKIISQLFCKFISNYTQNMAPLKIRKLSPSSPLEIASPVLF